MDKQKSIVIVLYQYSVVAKGIERMLTQSEYHVDVLNNNFKAAEGLAEGADLFVVYLPEDIMDDGRKIREFSDVLEAVRKNGKKMIVLGEKRYHAELTLLLPAVDLYTWFDRPVENEVLKKAVEDTLKGEMPTGEKKKILIVDDDPSYAGMVREWIKDHYRADVVTAGMQAITFLAKRPVDLILLDYEMPICDGPQVLQMLRQNPDYAGIPVVFLTGNGTKEAVSRVMELKPAGYILKSTTRADLLKYLKGKLG